MRTLFIAAMVGIAASIQLTSEASTNTHSSLQSLTSNPSKFPESLADLRSSFGNLPIFDSFDNLKPLYVNFLIHLFIESSGDAEKPFSFNETLSASKAFQKFIPMALGYGNSVIPAIEKWVTDGYMALPENWYLDPVFMSRVFYAIWAKYIMRDAYKLGGPIEMGSFYAISSIAEPGTADKFWNENAKDGMLSFKDQVKFSAQMMGVPPPTEE